MLKFEEDLSVGDLPLPTYEDLCAELNRNDGWKILARYVFEKLELESCSTWISDLEHVAKSKNENPANKLLLELNTRLCNVEILSILLEECNLLQAGSVLHQHEPLTIVSHPYSKFLNPNGLQVNIGQSICLKCEAKGLPPPHYQWYHEEVSLDGQTTNELNIPLKSATQRGLYRCEIYQVNSKGNKISTQTTKAVFVDMKSTAVAITKQPEVYLKIEEGDCLLLSCEAVGYPTPKYQWYCDNARLDEQKFNILRIKKFRTQLEGKYYCHVFNDFSEQISDRCTVMTESTREKALAKVALLIANESYDQMESLKSPKNDVAKVASVLEKLGFATICLADLTLRQMKNAIKIFSESLREGFYGLFYFAGHGFRLHENYMLATDSTDESLMKNALSESELLSTALGNNPTLLVVVLDMCQTFPSEQNGLDIRVEAPSGNRYIGRNLLLAYSTSRYRPSFERSNSEVGIYAKHLLKYLEDGLPVVKLFEAVAKSMELWSKGREQEQIPMISSTVTKPFRLTDTIAQGCKPQSIIDLEKITSFPEKVLQIQFSKAKCECKVAVTSYSKPFINLIRLSILELDDKWEINIYHADSTGRIHLFRTRGDNKFWLQTPDKDRCSIVMSLLENGVEAGVVTLDLSICLPPILSMLNSPLK